MGKERILVHICCAVDAIYFLKRLREDYPNAEIIGFFYDPNIHPYEEYLLRLKESERACQILGIKFIEGDYNLEGWLKKVKGYEHYPEKGARCVLCFDDRLEESVKKAKELSCNAFTTTLLMSPKKSQDQLKKVGENLAKTYGVEFIFKDYRKGGGVQEMNKLVRELQIWRQDYCGCLFALVRQKGENAFLDLTGFFGRLPGTKEEHIFIRQLKVFAELKGLPTLEEEFQFLGWFPLRGKLEIAKTKEVIPSLIKPFSAPIRGVAKGVVTKKVGNKLYLNKQNVVIELTERLKGYPVESPTLSNPTFVVEKKYEKLLLKNKLSATLEVRVEFAKSRNLIVGDIEKSQKVVLIPADTTFGGEGITLRKAEGIIDQLSEEIKEGKTAVAVLGAQSYSLGWRYLKELHPQVEEKLIVENP
ncbi:MAG: aminopeptidase [Aquificaceae bacterium]|nr:MAG: aminopeptidase [Aquificaceae bacterium]